MKNDFLHWKGLLVLIFVEIMSELSNNTFCNQIESTLGNLIYVHIYWNWSSQQHWMQSPFDCCALLTFHSSIINIQSSVQPHMFSAMQDMITILAQSAHHKVPARFQQACAWKPPLQFAKCFRFVDLSFRHCITLYLKQRNALYNLSDFYRLYNAHIHASSQWLMKRNNVLFVDIKSNMITQHHQACQPYSLISEIACIIFKL